MSEAPPAFTTQANYLDPNDMKMYHLPAWDKFDDRQKLDVIVQIIKQYGRDPRISALAVSILKQAGCKPREYKKQAEALLRFVQTQIYYINEPVERLQSPLHTLKIGFGDCDDLAILLCSLFESINLPWKLVISGQTPEGGLIRYHTGDAQYRQIPYSHIYCAVGDRPFTPTRWFYCEPTMEVPLGWDIVAAQTDPQMRSYLPELGAYGSTASGLVSGAVGETIVHEVGKEQKRFSEFSREIVTAVIVASLTAITTEIILDVVRNSEGYQSWLKRHKKPKIKKAAKV